MEAQKLQKLPNYQRSQINGEIQEIQITVVAQIYEEIQRVQTTVEAHTYGEIQHY